jgi:hypothetical protein
VVNKLLKKGVQVRYVPFPTVDFSAEGQLQRHVPELLIYCSGEPVDQTYAIRVSTDFFNTPEQRDVFRKTLKEV